MRTITILTISMLMGCFEHPTEDRDNQHTVDTTTSLIAKTSGLESDSIAFYSNIKNLEEIQFYIGGQDSILVTANPTDLIELNTTLHAFHSSFSKSDSGLIKYKTVDLLRKYHVLKRDGKSVARPSANIIQLTFKNTKGASDWFAIYNNSPYKNAIQAKPKTELWLDSNKVYFIQTYHTPERDYVNLLKKTLIKGNDK